MSSHGIGNCLLVSNIVGVPFDSIWVNLLGSSLGLDFSKLVCSIGNNFGLVSRIDKSSSGALVGNHLGLPL
jgi:hypothetical protein